MRGIDEMVRTCSPHIVTFVSIYIPDGADDSFYCYDVTKLFLKWLRQMASHSSNIDVHMLYFFPREYPK